MSSEDQPSSYQEGARCHYQILRALYKDVYTLPSLLAKIIDGEFGLLDESRDDPAYIDFVNSVVVALPNHSSTKAQLPTQPMKIVDRVISHLVLKGRSGFAAYDSNIMARGYQLTHEDSMGSLAGHAGIHNKFVNTQVNELKSFVWDILLE
ncbi:hypothetical protein EV182_003446, partial [Spiromyces aspiralis]